MSQSTNIFCLAALLSLVACKPDGDPVFKMGDVEFYNQDLVEWSTGRNSEKVDPNRGYFLNLKFNPDRGADIYKETKRNIGKPLKGILCGQFVGEPIVRAAMTVANFNLFRKESYANAVACLDPHKKSVSP